MIAKLLSLRLCMMLCAWLFACGYAAAQQVTVERDSALLAEPRADAPVVAQLKQGTSGEAVARQGAWVNIKTASGTGWLFSFNVRFGQGQAAASGGGAASLVGRLAGGGGKPSVNPTIGIRGLDEEDLKQARFDGQQLGLLDSYAASQQDAEATAGASGLTAVRVEYLDKAQ